MEINFQGYFKIARLSGERVCMSCTRKHGDTGDLFHALDTPLRLVGILEVPFLLVAEYLYRLEGFDTPGEFIDYWNGLHPGNNFQPLDQILVHFFQKFPESTTDLPLGLKVLGAFKDKRVPFDVYNVVVQVLDICSGNHDPKTLRCNWCRYVAQCKRDFDSLCNRVTECRVR